MLSYMRMSEGTISIIVGCHSAFHCLLVLVSWLKLYKSFPAVWELACICLHDIGHLGKDYLTDDRLKQIHWELGAKIAGKLYGSKGYDMVAGHCTESGRPLSKLYKPDKYSWYIAPVWWLCITNVLEPNIRRPDQGVLEEVRGFKLKVKASIESGTFRSTHDIYLENKGQL